MKGELNPNSIRKSLERHYAKNYLHEAKNYLQEGGTLLEEIKTCVSCRNFIKKDSSCLFHYEPLEHNTTNGCIDHSWPYLKQIYLILLKKFIYKSKVNSLEVGELNEILSKLFERETPNIYSVVKKLNEYQTEKNKIPLWFIIYLFIMMIIVALAFIFA